MRNGRSDEQILSTGALEVAYSNNNTGSVDAFKKSLSFKDFKGFKTINDINERYVAGKVIGEGSFGKVRLAKHKKANIECAIKMIKKKK